MNIFGNKIYDFLSNEDLNRISSEIKTVENNTSAEVVVSIKYNIPFFLNNNIYKFALYLFKFYKLYRTKNRNSVLILFVLKNRQFYILGDEGIYKKIDKNIWDELSSKISCEIQNKNLLDGIILSVNEVSKLINDNFPKEIDDIDEISNDVKL